MSSGQLLLTLGALILLSTSILNVNKNFTHIDTSLIQNKSRLEALSLLSSYIEQSSQFLFDETVADTASEKKLSDFTEPGYLGFDGDDNGEVDDFDDFDGLTVADTGRSGVIFNVSYKVEYVKLSSHKIIPSSSKEYHKRMTISIYDSYNPPLIYKETSSGKVKDTLSVSFVHSYWFYN